MSYTNLKAQLKELKFRKIENLILIQLMLLFLLCIIPIASILFNRDHRIHFRKGVALGEAENWNLATQAFERASSLSSDNPLYFSHLSISYARLFQSGNSWTQIVRQKEHLSQEQKDYLQLSIDSMEKACELNPFANRYKLHLGWLYIFDQQFELAEKYIQAARKNDRENPQALASLAIAQICQHNLKDAQETIRLLIKSFPLVIESRLWQYIKLQFSGKTLNQLIQDNIHFFENDTNLDPISLAHLGHLYYYTQQIDKAKECFLKAKSIRPYLQGSHYQLGRIYYSEGNLSGATREFHLAALTGFPPAFFCLGTIYQEIGNEKLVLQMFSTYNRLLKSNFLDNYNRKTIKHLYRLLPLSNQQIPDDFLNNIYPISSLTSNG